MSKDQDIQGLVAAARAGDMDAFDVLVSRYSVAVRSLCMMRLANPDQADDIAQQVFLTAWKRLGELKDESGFWPWLQTITRFHITNEWRRMRRERDLRQRYTLECLGQAESEDEADVDADMLAMRIKSLRVCLEGLPPDLSNLVKLRYNNNCTSQQIGDQLGRPADTVRQTFVRLREKLRQCIERRLAEKGLA